jgi:hypothetical protein
MNATPQQPAVPAPVRQTARAFDMTYSGLIDVSDFGNRPPDKIQPAFRSRALAVLSREVVDGDVGLG